MLISNCNVIIEFQIVISYTDLLMKRLISALSYVLQPNNASGHYLSEMKVHVQKIYSSQKWLLASSLLSNVATIHEMHKLELVASVIKRRHPSCKVWSFLKICIP